MKRIVLILAVLAATACTPTAVPTSTTTVSSTAPVEAIREVHIQAPSFQNDSYQGTGTGWWSTQIGPLQQAAPFLEPWTVLDMSRYPSGSRLKVRVEERATGGTLINGQSVFQTPDVSGFACARLVDAAEGNGVTQVKAVLPDTETCMTASVSWPEGPSSKVATLDFPLPDSGEITPAIQFKLPEAPCAEPAGCSSFGASSSLDWTIYW
jgi:hypothetical protein